MPRFQQICTLAQEYNLPVSKIFKDYLLTPKKRYEIIEKLTTLDEWDSESEPNDLDQMCETPTSQKKILSFF